VKKVEIKMWKADNLQDDIEPFIINLVESSDADSSDEASGISSKEDDTPDEAGDRSPNEDSCEDTSNRSSRCSCSADDTCSIMSGVDFL